nr:MAG TPA_asm: hypothetical protein [Bacteriophage sp.]
MLTTKKVSNFVTRFFLSYSTSFDIILNILNEGGINYGTL